MEESLKLDESYPGQITEHLYQVKKLYKKSGNQERYHSYLRQFVVKRADIGDYRELKSLYSDEEWLFVRVAVFSVRRIVTLFDRAKSDASDDCDSKWAFME